MPSSYLDWSDGEQYQDFVDEEDSDDGESEWTRNHTAEDVVVDEAVEGFWYNRDDMRDEAPSPEEKGSVQDILNNILATKPPTLPFAGFDRQLAKHRLVVDGERITLPLSEGVANSLVAKYGSNEDSLVEINQQHLQVGEIERLYRLVTKITHQLGLTGDDDYDMEFKVQKLVVNKGDKVSIKLMDAACDAEAVLIVPLSGDGTIAVRGDDNVEHGFEWKAGSNKYLNFVLSSPDGQFTIGGTSSRGAQAALVYSVHLGEDVQYLSKRPGNKHLSAKLSQALKLPSLRGPAVLLFEGQYTDKELAVAGISSALKGVDLERVQRLEHQSETLTPDTKLKLLPVKLVREVTYYPIMDLEDWEEEKSEDVVTWCSFGPGGKEFRSSDDLFSSFTYLNPGHQTLEKMWAVSPTSEIKPPSDEDNHRFKERIASRRGLYDYDEYDPPTPTKHVRYTKYAVIITLQPVDVEAIAKLSSKEIAAAFVQHHAPADPAKLRVLLETVGRFTDESLEWWQTVCESIALTNDFTLVKLFFDQFECSENANSSLAPALSRLVSQFGWEAMKELYFKCFRWVTSGRIAVEAFLDLTTSLIDNLEDPNLKDVVLESLFDEAMYVDAQKIDHYLNVVVTWKATVRCGNKATFDRFVGMLKHLGPSTHIIDLLTKHGDKEGFSRIESEAFYGFVDMKVEALKENILKGNQPAAWEIPDACFPDNPEVEAFLRGPESSMVLKSLKDEASARAWMEKCFEKGYNVMFSMEYFWQWKGLVMILSKYGYKHVVGDEYGPDPKDQLAKLLEKYYPAGLPNPAYLPA